MLVKAFLCSESIILDAASNRASCINILDGMISPQFPILLPQFAVIGMFERQEGDLDEHNCELKITLDDLEIARGPVLVSFQGLALTRAMVTMHGIVVPRTGTLKATISENDAELATWLIQVTQAEQQLG